MLAAESQGNMAQSYKLHARCKVNGLGNKWLLPHSLGIQAIGQLTESDPYLHTVHGDILHTPGAALAIAARSSSEMLHSVSVMVCRLVPQRVARRVKKGVDILAASAEMSKCRCGHCEHR